MTLICAPAGFGKSTLLIDWIAEIDRPVAWVSLEHTENDPIYFVRYLAGALQTIEKTAAENVVSMLETADAIPIEALMIHFIDEVSKVKNDFLLILDDFHAVDNPDVHKVIAFFLDRMPGNMHLAVATRVDPCLPLSRMKVSNQLTEIRASDLCFNPDEIASFFSEIMALNLDKRLISILESKTEGWIAGLQLAALSIRGQDDVSGFIDDFAGNDRHIVDYLVEEVLQLQPENVQSFLLQTSILNRLSGPLCDFVTGRNDSRKIIDAVERANLFIIPLDTKRQWYRYHHLFGDLLRQRLQQKEGDRVRDLHGKASEWFEAHGSKAEAIEHALAAKAFERAAALIEAYTIAKWHGGEQVTLLKWMDLLPDNYKMSKPNLGLCSARVLFQSGRQRAAERLIDQLETTHDLIHTKKQSAAAGDSGPQNSPEMTALRGRIAAIKAYMATRKGDIPNIINHSQQALKELPEEDATWRAIVATSSAIAHDLKGDSAAAIEAHKNAINAAMKAGNFYLYLIGRLWLAIAFKNTGQLPEAMNICRQMFTEIEDKSLAFNIAVGHVWGTWGEMRYESNDLDEAYRFEKKGVALLEQGHDVSHLGWRYTCLVKILCSKQRLAVAEKIVPKMNRLLQSSVIPPWVTTHIRAVKASILLMKGDIDGLDKWVIDCGLKLGDAPAWVNDPEQIMFSRVLIAQNRLDDALVMLDRLITENAKAGRVLNHIETLIIKSIALKKKQRLPEAIDTALQAITLAEPGGYVRVFVDEGRPLEALIEAVDDFGSRKVKDFAQKLLVALKAKKYANEQEGLIEPLSERELEVLRLLSAGLSNKKMTHELFISTNTVKTHLKNIYAKLSVNKRTEAVTRARELNLL